jgi:hypothetical protein
MDVVPVVVPVPVMPLPVVAVVCRLVVVLVVVSVLEHAVMPSVVSATAKVMSVIFFMWVGVGVPT